MTLATAAELSVLLTLRDQMSQSLSKAESQLQAAQKSVAATESQVTSLGKTLEQASGRLNSVGQSAVQTGQQMSLAFTAPLVAIGGAALKMGADYESVMAQIRGLTTATGAEVDKFSVQVLEMSKKFPQSAEELAQALYFITSSGVKASDSMTVLNAAATAAAGGLGTTKVVADAVTSVLNAYKLSATDAARVTDILTQTVISGKGEPAELAAAIGRVIPIAAAAGVSFEEVSASIATMTNTGLDANEATTALRGVLGALEAPGSKAAAALKEIGLSAQQVRDSIREKGLLATLSDLMERTHGNIEVLDLIIPNIRALTGVLSSAGSQADAYSQNLAAMQHATGAAQKAFDEAAKTAQFNLSKALNVVKADMIGLANEALPAITRLLSFLSTEGPAAVGRLADAFRGLPTSVQEGALAFVALAAAAGPSLVVIGKFAQLGSALLTPTGLWTLGIIAAAAALITLYRNSELARDAMDTMLAGVGNLADLFQAMVGPLSLLPPQIVAVGAAIAGLTLAFTVLAPEITVAVAALAGFAFAAGKADQIARAVADAIGLETHKLAENTDIGFKNAQAQTEIAAAVAKLKAEHATSAQIVEELRLKYQALAEAYSKVNTNEHFEDAARFAGAMTEVNKVAQSLGVTFTQTIDAQGNLQIGMLGSVQTADALSAALATTARTTEQTGQKAEEAAPRVVPFAAALAQLAKVAKEGGDQLEAASKIIDDFAGHATGAEQVLTRQQHALDAVGSSTQAAFSSGNKQLIVDMTAAAHDAASKADISAEAHKRLDQEIDAVARTAGTQYHGALDTLKKDLDGLKSPLADQSKAYSDQRTLTGDLAKEQLGLAGSMTDLKDTIKSLVDVLLISLGKIPPAMADVVTKTKEGFQVDYSKEGAATAETFLSGFAGVKVTIINSAGDLAIKLRQQMHIDLSGEGATAASTFARAFGAVEGSVSFIVGRVNSILAGLAQIPGAAATAANSLTPLSAVNLSNLDPVIARSLSPLAQGLVQIQDEGPGAGAALGDMALQAQLLEDVPGSIIEIGEAVTTLRPAIIEIGEAVTTLNPAIIEIGTAVTTLGPAIRDLFSTSAIGNLGTRQFAIDVADLNLKLANLKVQLSETAPYTVEAQALQNEIQLLDGVKGRYDAVAAARSAANAAALASKTAGDFFGEESGKLAQHSVNLTLFGPGGADVVEQLVAAFKDPAAGTKAADAVNTFLTSEAFKHLPGAVELSHAIWDAVLDSINDPGNQDKFQAAISLLMGAQDQVRAAGTLSGTTFGTAFQQAISASALKDAVGGTGAQLLQQLADAVDPEKGGAAVVAAAGQTAAQILASFAKLPPQIGGPLATEFTAALRAYALDPTQENMDAVKAILTTAATNFEILPESLKKLSPVMKDEFGTLYQLTLAHQLDTKEVKQLMASDFGVIPKELRDHYGPAIRESLAELLHQYEAHAISYEQLIEGQAAVMDSFKDKAKADADEIHVRTEMVKQEISDARKWFEANGFDKPYPGPGAALGGGGGSAPGAGGGGADEFTKPWWVFVVNMMRLIGVANPIGAGSPFGQSIPHFAGGGYVARDTLAYVHAGERVQTPAQQQSAPVNITINVPVDTVYSMGDFQQQVRGFVQREVVPAISQAMRGAH